MPEETDTSVLTSVDLSMRDLVRTIPRRKEREGAMKTNPLLMPVLVGALALGGGCGIDDADVSAASNAVYANTVSFRGQGLLLDGFGGYDLRTELCGIANGADADGPYLLWVLTATRASQADITGPWGTALMTQSGKGTFKYVSDWYDPDSLIDNVSASYDGKVTNVQLVISHGCRPFEEIGAWCSPGFWRNATDAAWELTGYSRATLFNSTVYDHWYGAAYEVNPTLQTVLTNAPTYSGPPLPGTSGYALNAFNATGAMLTDAIPGNDGGPDYRFDFDIMQGGSSDACPIDHFGNYK
jgi:hypothetical protein